MTGWFLVANDHHQRSDSSEFSGFSPNAKWSHSSSGLTLQWEVKKKQYFAESGCIDDAPSQLNILLFDVSVTKFFSSSIPPGHETATARHNGLPGYARGENRHRLLRSRLCQRELHQLLLHKEGYCKGECVLVIMI